MGVYLDETMFLDVDNAEELISELEGHLSLRYPGLSPDMEPAKLALLVALLKPVIRRWAAVGTGLDRTEVAGPFQDRISGGGGHVLWEREQSDILALSGTAGAAGLPDGCFPEKSSTDRLFASRPRSAWC